MNNFLEMIDAFFKKRNLKKNEEKTSTNQKNNLSYEDYRKNKEPKLDKKSKLWPFAMIVAEGFFNENILTIQQIVEKTNGNFVLDDKFLRINKKAWPAFADCILKYGLAQKCSIHQNEIEFLNGKDDEMYE